MTAHNVFLAWPAPAVCSSAFAMSLAAAMRHPVQSRITALAWYASGPMVGEARNVAVHRLLDGHCEWLLQLDSDMTFTGEDLEQLLDSAHVDRAPIVGALYVGLGPEPGTTLADALWFTADGERVHLDPRQAQGLTRVDAVGTGCLLVHRRVFTRIQQGWFDPHPGLGEDHSFCIRAGAAGFPVFVNASVPLGHVKTTILRPPSPEELS